MLNVVLFGKTARQWKDENPTVKGNMRDVATLNQLLVLKDFLEHGLYENEVEDWGNKSA